MEKLILGCAPAAGLYHQPSAPESVAALLNAAAAAGIRLIDTAPWYGCGGSEIDIGRAFEANAELAVRLEIATKFGRIRVPRERGAAAEFFASGQSGLPEPTFWRRFEAALTQDTCYAPHPATAHLVCIHDATAVGAATSWRQSCEALGPLAAARVTILRLHDTDTEELFVEAMAGAIPWALAQRASGAVRWQLSLGLNSADWALRYVQGVRQRGAFSSVMIAGCWNLIDQDAALLLDECAKKKICVHVAGVFGAGLLWGAETYKYEAAGAEPLRRREEWKAVLAKHLPGEGALPAFAIRFALSVTPPVTHIAVGCRTADELSGCVAAALRASAISRATFFNILSGALQKELLDSDAAIMLDR